MKHYKYPFRKVYAGIYVFITMFAVIAAVLQRLVSCIFALLHIELQASPHTHLNLERTNGLNDLVIGIITAAGSAVISALLLRLLCRPNKKDRALIASAKPPVWGKISKKDLEYLRQQPNPAKRELVICFAVLLTATLLTGLPSAFSNGWLVIIGILWAISLTAAILRVRYCRMWQRIDDTAQCAVIPVYRKVTREERQSRKSVRKTTYLVCYLPDGIYQFENRSEKPDPCTVHIIRYHGFYRYIPR